jgi:hypothetical protein
VAVAVNIALTFANGNTASMSKEFPVTPQASQLRGAFVYLVIFEGAVKEFFLRGDV